jgi:hypothetical protein
MRKVGLLVAVLALLGAAATLNAQTATGQISGTVRDSSGAVVPGATVTVNNELTGLTRTATTDANGDYVFARLPPATYSIQAELQGFSVARETGIRLLVDNSIRVDLTLALGEMSETVEVESSSVLLQSEAANISQTLTEKQITELPLNGRNFLQLLFLQAGAVQTNGEQGTMRQGAGNAISLQGARPTSNNFMIDGTANIDTSLGTPAAILSVDAMEEFTQQNKTYSAEYGFSANQINLVSKSGSNEFHGTGFYFGRNEAWDARNFFDDPDAEKPNLDQKQFGGTVSGPIVKNKTFFLFNYEGTRIEEGSTGFYRVPTADMLAGVAREPIVDPFTGQPFPNNTVPRDRWSRLSALAVDEGWWPTPNTDSPLGNYTAVLSFPTTQNQYNVRVDQDLGRFGRVFARYTKTKFENESFGTLSLPRADWEGGNRVFVQDTTNWQVTHTWPIKSNIVNVIRVGHIEALADQHGKACPQSWVDQLQLTGIYSPIPDVQRECPTIAAITNIAGVGGPVNAYTASNQPMWDISNTTTWVTGSHTITFGANFRRWWLQRDLATGFTGDLQYGTNFAGDTWADFLLGTYSAAAAFQPGPFSVEGAVGNPRETNWIYFAPYVQDDWRVSPKLTLNLGLRWDYRNVPYETNDRMGWRNLDYPAGGLLVADQSLQAGGIIPDDGYYQLAGRRSPENPDRFKVFAPRISFTYRPFEEGDTVIRGGYGIFYDNAEGREIDGSADIYPYAVRTNLQQSLGIATINTTDNIFPDFSIADPASPAANTFLAVSMSPEPRNPFVQQWSLSIQHLLTRTTNIEVSYVGSHGENLLMRRNIAQALPYTPDQPTVAERKPYPNFGVYIDAYWNGYSDYHALNVSMTHRGRGLVATAAYTWGKSTDSKSAAAGIGANESAGWQGFLNNHDPERDHGLSSFDVAQRFVASFVWNLPFGQGERWASDATGLKQAIVGGWQLNGIYLLQGGFPISIFARDEGGLNDSFNNRANIVGDIHADGGTQERWFNTDAFAQPAEGELGNSGRSVLRGPGWNQLDLGLFKNFYIADTTLQFRVEAFNALNHTQWQGVSQAVQNADFGRITSARDARIVQLGVKFLW